MLDELGELLATRITLNSTFRIRNHAERFAGGEVVCGICWELCQVGGGRGPAVRVEGIVRLPSALCTSRVAVSCISGDDLCN